MTWDIQTGLEQEYFEFVVRDFIPGLQSMGMNPSDAWFTMYGNQPQIMASAEMNSINTLRDLLDTSEWDSLTQRLLEYVDNFDYKIIQSRSGFQL
jgi:hypothetical protein